MNTRMSDELGPKNDEIDLALLIQRLWQQRWLISGVALLIGLAATVYAVLSTPYYQAQSILKPASLQGFDELNLTGFYEVDRNEVLRRAGVSLESYSTRYAFYQANPQLFRALERSGESMEQAFERLNESAFSVLRPDPKKVDSLSRYVGLRFIYPQGIDGPAVVNGLIAYVIAQERVWITDEINTLVANRKNALRRKISAARVGYETAKQSKIAQLLETDNIARADLHDDLSGRRQQLKLQRENRITQLTEAIMIAGQLGISKPTAPTVQGDAVEQAQGNLIWMNVNNQQVPLYFLGTEALSAERQALMSRDSDDFTDARIGEIESQLSKLERNRQVEALHKRDNDDLFLNALAKWEEEISLLEALAPEVPQQLVAVDQPAVPPLSPIKPRKVLIVAGGLVVGIMLGVFVALIRSVLRQFRENAHG